MGVRLTDAVACFFDPVEEEKDGSEMEHISDEAEYVHFKFNTY